MIVEGAIGRVDPNDPTVDWIDVDWTCTLRRAMRLVSRAGRRVNVLLPPGRRLRHLDLLAFDGPTPIAMNVREVDTLRIVPANLEQAARIALALGNQHAPVEIDGPTIYVLDDGPARQIVNECGAAFERCRHRLHPNPMPTSALAEWTVRR